MSMKSKQVLKYLNLAREYPKYYVGLIDQQLNSFVDQFNIKLGEDVIYETIEGKTLWQEAKTFLLNQEPLRPLEFHEGLAKAASDHSKDIVKNQSTGHTGSDGSTFIQRIQRYCKKGKGSMIELLGTTHKIVGKNSIELGILNFLIDDGVTNRGHRRALFSKDYKYVGLQFCQFQDKIYSVVTITQANLENVFNMYQSVGTSMGNFANLPESISQIKDLNSVPQKQKSRNSVLQKEKGKASYLQAHKQNDTNAVQQRSMKKQSTSLIEPQKSMATWTFRNVDSNIKPFSNKNEFAQKNHEPSIFKQVDQSVQSVDSNRNAAKGSFSKAGSKKDCKQNSISDVQINIKLKESTKSISSNSSSHSLPKQSSAISAKDYEEPKKSHLKTSQGFGLVSEVENFRQKNALNSVFSKSNGSSIGLGSGISKKIVQKNEKIRNWCEDGFAVKQITTMIKYEDGAVENFIQKHSILKDSSNSIHSQQ